MKMMKTSNKIEYLQCAKAKIQDQRSLVISFCSKGGFTIAQQLDVKEGDKAMSVFLKGAFHVDDVQGLINIRNAIDETIKFIESENEG